MLPTIATGNVASALAGEYEVANSLRFNDDSSDYLNRTGTSGTADYKMTYSAWFKRGNIGSGKELFCIYKTNSNRLFLRNNGDTFEFQISGQSNSTTREFRDVSAWFHLVIAVDTTQATESDRIKWYVNGEYISDGGSSIGQNTSLPHYSSGANYYIGNGEYNSSVYSNYWDGYMAEVCFIDGQQLDATSFGEFDSDSPTIWKPIDVSGLTFGTNGFYLDFENSGSLGADVSGNGNNFTVNNLTSVDQSTDTCTNNFATLNPLVTLSGGTLSEGNLKYNYGSNGWRSSFSTIGAKKGKWYCEAKFDSGTYLVVGIVDEDGYSRNSGNFLADSTFNYSHGYGYFSNDGHGNSTGKDGQGTDVTYGNAFSAGDIIGIAMDLDNGKLYFSKNGTFQNSGDPTSGSTGTGSVYNITNSTTLNYFFGVSPYNATVSLNIGSPSFSISSGNSDANGFGNFEYSVPSGYFTLNTKNLAEFG
jgi:hypothetical protein